MPFFNYKCCKCGGKGERLIVSKADRTCIDCDAAIVVGDRVLSPYDGISLRSFTPYFDAGLGVQLNSQRERQMIMKERGLVEVGNEIDRMERNVNTDFDTGVSDEEFRVGWEKAIAVDDGGDPACLS